MTEARRLRRALACAPMQESLDLFGEVVVTWPEVYAWIEAVAGIARDSPRADYYVRAWNVAAKVASAKLDGTYDDILRSYRPPGVPWLQRFRWRY
jgi:hypothetical protein